MTSGKVKRIVRAKIPKALQRSEHDEQRDFFTWAEKSGRWELALMFAIPNFAGHHGSMVSRIVSGKRAKAEGRKPGVPDIFLPVPRLGYHGLFIEMKKANGVPSDVTDDQRGWFDTLSQQGYRVEVCYGCESAILAIANYFRL